MGIIRGGLLIVVSVALFVILLAGNILLTLSMSLEYEVVKPKITSVIKETFGENFAQEEIQQKFAMIENYCQTNTEYVFSEDQYGQTFTIPCSIVPEGINAVIEYNSDKFIDNIYYKEYDCSFWDCITSKDEKMLVLVSAKAEDYWTGKFYTTLVIALILFGLVFLLVETKSNSFLITGSLLVVSAIPFLKIEKFLSFVPFKFGEYLTVFFSQALAVFWVSFISGIIFLGVGIVMKFFGFGFKLSELFSKFGKNKKVVVKEKIASKKPNNL